MAQVRKTLHCGRCDGTEFNIGHVGRLGDLAPPWWKEVDRTCQGCGNMVFTYETMGRGPKEFGIVDNGYVKEVDPTEYATCPACDDEITDDDEAELVVAADHGGEGSPELRHADCV